MPYCILDAFQNFLKCKDAAAARIEGQQKTLVVGNIISLNLIF